MTTTSFIASCRRGSAGGADGVRFDAGGQRRAANLERRHWPQLQPARCPLPLAERRLCRQC